MIDDLRSIAIFAETITQGSFRAAATQLGLSPSVVSYHVTQLEKRVGTALIYRSTRKLSLTHEGDLLYQSAKDMLTAADQGLNRITAKDDRRVGGKLTITLPAGLSRAPINKQIAEFAKLYSNIKLKISYTDLSQDLIGQGIDLAFRAGDMKDSSLRSKRIGQIERKLVCSIDYLENQIKPKALNDLAAWDWIKLEMLPSRRTLIDASGQRIDISFNSRITVDSVDAMTQLCIHGMGLATPPSYLIEEELKLGKVVELFRECHVCPIPLFAVWPANVSENSNSKRLLSYLISNNKDNL